jgi:hypothetical protein
MRAWRPAFISSPSGANPGAEIDGGRTRCGVVLVENEGRDASAGAAGAGHQVETSRDLSPTPLRARTRGGSSSPRS